MATAAEGDGGGTVVARLFVGGLAEGVSAADLEGVFGSIGRVAGVEFVRTSGRCFAYVDFQCPSDKALTKLFSTYNGCKWKGGKLKLEKAKEHYLVRLKREWEQEAAAAQEVPAEENVEKPEDKEKLKLERDALLTSKVNIYFPKLRKLRPLPFKGSGKHKYSFRNIEVPSYPIHFCDCEEHCGPPEKANEEYAAALNRVASEKERSIMNSVMSKLLEKDNEQLDTEEVQKRDDDVNITEPSDAETEPSDSDTEPSDEENDLRIEETKETAEEDLDDLQMEETDDPSEEELDDDLVINIVTRKANKSVVQSNVATQAVNKDEQFRKRKQFEDASAQNKRQKLEDSSEPRNKKQSSSVISERKTTPKSLSAISGANHSKQKSSGLPLGGTHGFSSVLDRAKSSGGLQGVDALTDPSTKKEGSQSELATEPKKGSLWTQKSAWRDLVGGMGAASFSLSQVLPNTNPAPAKLPTGSWTSVARAESKKKVTFVEESLNSVEAVTQPSAGQKLLPSSVGAPSTGTTDGSAGHDSLESSENNKVVEARMVPKITISEVCPFMRNKESEQQWSKAKKVLTGFNKRGEEKAGSSNAGRGKAPSRRR
ncbi:protein REPRESSOR OF SILENCING 3-like [Lolium rigidum]|uniref:protein REPRESSOR OF SILENCING 3-like n=1 Tax=Lolium rigidum TaxID=89674 RepID=UPI001F5E02BC|nr:protein REPRESSOR OF SILENCING 3-like [Lolium rigidum]